MADDCPWCEGEGCDECSKPKTTKSKKDKKEKELPKKAKKPKKKLEDDEDGWGPEDGGGDGGFGDDDFSVVQTEAPTTKKHQAYTLLTPSTLAERQKAIISEAAEELSLSAGEAGCALRRYQWDYEKLKNEWYADSKKVRVKVGITAVKGKPGIVPKSGKVQCTMWGCDEVAAKDASCLSCGHWFCNACWGDILQAKVKDGRGCIFTVCPAMRCTKDLCQHSSKKGCKCDEMIPEDFMRRFVTDKELLLKYERWLDECFVEGSKLTIKWCPRPGCTSAVEYSEGGQKEIQCSCGHKFCFGCGRTMHAPAPCDLVELYEKMGSTDDATEALLAATTKQCPGCKVRITKNKACNHMTCAKCRHEFCWLCKGAWKEHGGQTGGYYVCNKYNENSAKGIFNDEEKEMKEKQQYLQSPAYIKYLFYRQHFDHHRDAAKFADKFIKTLEKHKEFSKFKKVVNVTESIIAARNILQWTYCLSYYLKPGTRKDLFETQQHSLNNLTEQLQEMLESHSKESDVDQLLDPKLHQEMVTRARSVDGFRSKTLEATDSPEFVGLLDYKVFKGEGDSWACTACAKTHTGPDMMKLKHCPNTSCGACRIHGEPECRVPSCKKD